MNELCPKYSEGRSEEYGAHFDVVGALINRPPPAPAGALGSPVQGELPFVCKRLRGCPSRSQTKAQRSGG